jgi:hypothetical protein
LQDLATNKREFSVIKQQPKEKIERKNRKKNRGQLMLLTEFPVESGYKK